MKIDLGYTLPFLGPFFALAWIRMVALAAGAGWDGGVAAVISFPVGVSLGIAVFVTMRESGSTFGILTIGKPND